VADWIDIDPTTGRILTRQSIDYERVHEITVRWRGAFHMSLCFFEIMNTLQTCTHNKQKVALTQVEIMFLIKCMCKDTNKCICTHVRMHENYNASVPGRKINNPHY
jgi:hypothetical protein